VGVSQPSIYTSGQTIPWYLNADMLAEYTALLQFYKNSDAAKNGTLNPFSDADFIVFEKTLDSSRVLVIINSRASDLILSVPTNLHGNWKNAQTGQALALSGQLPIPAHGYLILEK
jgi:hypothetical protein